MASTRRNRHERTIAHQRTAGPRSGCRFSVHSVGFRLVLDFVVRNVIANPISGARSWPTGGNSMIRDVERAKKFKFEAGVVGGGA